MSCCISWLLWGYLRRAANNFGPWKLNIMILTIQYYLNLFQIFLNISTTWLKHIWSVFYKCIERHSSLLWSNQQQQNKISFFIKRMTSCIILVQKSLPRVYFGFDFHASSWCFIIFPVTAKMEFHIPENRHIFIHAKKQFHWQGKNVYSSVNLDTELPQSGVKFFQFWYFGFSQWHLSKWTRIQVMRAPTKGGGLSQITHSQSNTGFYRIGVENVNTW